MSSSSCRVIRLIMRWLHVLGLLVYLFVTGRTGVAFFPPGVLKLSPHKWLASRKIWSVEKLETLPVGTKPRTWHLERGVEKESARRSPSKGRERAIVNQTNIGTVSKATLGKLLRDGVECIIMGFSERIDIILNWTKWTELSQSFERCITVLTVDSLGPVEENFQPLTF